MTTAEQSIEVRGIQVPCYRVGAGEPLLYLHGIFGDLFSVPGGLLPFHEKLAERYDVIAPAHPGFAEAFAGLEAIDSIEDMALHYLDLIEALGLEKVHLIGHSLGGWIAAELAVRCSHVLRSLTLISACGLTVKKYPIGDFFYAAAPRPKGDRQLLRDLVFADPADGFAQGLLPNPDPDQPLDDHQLLLYRAQVASARVGWSPPYLRSLNLARRLGRISVPTLLVWGGQDRLTPPQHAEAYREGIPGARAVVSIPGGAHCLVAQRPDETAQAVLDFLPGVDGG
jgi:pimeloyl-ACP methyl ester carboxylesterase